MVFWLWKRGKHEKLEKDIKRLNKKLESSFKNLNVDMKTISKWFNHLNEHKTNHHERIDQLEKQMRQVFSLVDYHNDKISNLSIESEKPIKIPLSEESKEEFMVKIFSSNKILQELTETRKKMLLTLTALAVEMGNWVSMKSLTEEIYPSKDYSDVKSMVSDYTNNLYDLGLIEKKRKGREVYLGLTEKGKQLTQNIFQIEKLRIKTKKKKN